MLHSLRARLVVGLLALTAAGLLALAVTTYLEQRSFLTDRTDEQLRQAPQAVSRALDDRTQGEPLGQPRRRDGDDRPGGPGVGLPPGTYGQQRDASGKVLDDVVLSYRQSEGSKPDLPATIEVGRPITVGSDGSAYRVLAVPTPFGQSGTTVVALPLREVDATLDRLLLVEALVGGVLLLLVGSLTWVVVRVGLLPLDRMGHTAGAIAGGDLSQRVEATDPRSEVGRLGRALNAMLGRLEHAFAERQASEDRLRRFLADASHELRTPLVSIRGYAELYRIGAAREPAEVEKAMTRIEDEAQRMGVLVEDLLTLARLDEVADAPHVPVDLSAVAGDAVHDARAVAPGRAIELRGPRDTSEVSGNADQLRQVLANLLRNALVHTPAESPIEVELEEGAVHVRDHGPGLPEGDDDALFERFWRAEGGRERGKGAGLGLAIVAGIVDAHGGRVAAANADGGGARFSVWLPLSGASQHGPIES